MELESGVSSIGELLYFQKQRCFAKSFERQRVHASHHVHWHFGVFEEHFQELERPDEHSGGLGNIQLVDYFFGFRFDSFGWDVGVSSAAVTLFVWRWVGWILLWWSLGVTQVQQTLLTLLGVLVEESVSFGIGRVFQIEVLEKEVEFEVVSFQL